MRPECSIFLLGGFRADVDGRPVPDDAWRHRRGADLLKLLALAPGHRMHREQLIDALWPELPPEAGGPNLRKAVHYARRALGNEGAVAVEGVMVGLWPSAAVTVDAERFEATALDSLRRGDSEAAARAATLYAGDLLPEDSYEPWAGAPRERLRRRYLEVLKLAAMWERVVELDPLDEEAHRRIMRSHIEEGNRPAALRQFERMREALREELGVSPDEESVVVFEQALALEGHEPETPGERARAHLAAGLMAMNRMDLDEAERQAREARSLAVDATLGRELGEASGLLGMVAHMRGAWRDLFREEFLSALDETPALAGVVFDAHLCLAQFWLHGLEGPDRVEEFARELLAVAEDRDSVHGRAVATMILGEAELLAGRLDAAERELSGAADLHGRAGAAAGRALSLQRLAEAALARDRRSRTARLLRDALALATDSPLSSHLQVRVHGTRVLLAQSPSSALETAREAEALLQKEDVCEPCSIGFLVASSVAGARAGELDEARRNLEHAERVAGMWQGGPWLAAVWEARAELRLAEDDARQAAALFREGADLFGRFGHALAESRCRSAAAMADRGVRSGNGRGTHRA